jgi:predicted O-methyltransferase YrrM
MQPDLKGNLKEIEDYGKENNVPIVTPIMHRFLEFILSIKRPRNILEFGTAIGFSSILMSKYASGKIITLERNERMRVVADRNIKEAGLEDKIEIKFGDAIENVKNLDEKFDIIFIDAAKSKYQEFFDVSYPMLDDGGIIIADNVLNKGDIAKPIEDIERRNRTIHRGMNKFIENMLNDERFETVLLPFSDGVLLAHKKEVE